MNDTYAVLTLLETVPLGIFMVCLFFGGEKRWCIITRFFTVVALLIFNILQRASVIAVTLFVGETFGVQSKENKFVEEFERCRKFI